MHVAVPGVTGPSDIVSVSMPEQISPGQLFPTCGIPRIEVIYAHKLIFFIIFIARRISGHPVSGRTAASRLGQGAINSDRRSNSSGLRSSAFAPRSLGILYVRPLDGVDPSHVERVPVEDGPPAEARRQDARSLRRSHETARDRLTAVDAAPMHPVPATRLPHPTNAAGPRSRRLVPRQTYFAKSRERITSTRRHAPAPVRVPAPYDSRSPARALPATPPRRSCRPPRRPPGRDR